MPDDSTDLSKRWVEVRPSRVSVATIHARRIRYTWGNSKPFLSGDLFSDEADVSYNSPKFRRLKPSLREIKEARVVFCPSSDVEEFFVKYQGYAKPSVLICGNGDRDFTQLPENLPTSLKHVFLQNAFIPNSSFSTALPIGLENLRWGRNGFPRLMRNEFPWNLRRQKIMIGPFGLTHQERFSIRESFPSSTECVEVFASRLSPHELSTVSQGFRFIAAVRGNGVDTHRHWESAYRGAYAIVMRDNWFRNFEHLGLPFIGIDSWNEIDRLEEIVSTYQAPRDPRSIPALWWPYWKAQIESKLYEK
jgi:hypothetical protein